MTRIALVVSDVDGTLVTKDKVLTDGARSAVQRLHDAGIGFTITSSRPPIGLRFLVAPLGITLPMGPFNGSSIVGTDLKQIEQHLIPAAAVQKSLDVLNEFGVDIWLFTNEAWIIKRDDGTYVPHERHTIQHDPVFADNFTPYVASACKIVGASGDPALLGACERVMQRTLGDEALAIRSQTYYLDITPPGQNKGTFVQTMANRLGIATDAVATIGDMQNDLAMFKVSGLSIAMGNATDDVKQQASQVTKSNEDEGFAGAVEMILQNNAAS
jgi:Cof subfamily protein (haloacid dehalogenase superfamily)